jgi:hypothetical protein
MCLLPTVPPAEFVSPLKSDDNKDAEPELDRSALHALLAAMDIEIGEAEFEQWFVMADASGNGLISRSELLPFLHNLESNEQHATRVWRYFEQSCLGGAGRDGALLMEGISQPRSTAAHILIRERGTGRQIRENIPKYITVALRSMFGTSASRYLSNLSSSVAIAKRASEKQGIKYNDPASAAEIPPFVELHSINLDECEKKVADFKNFNEFFARTLKPDARYVAAHHHPPPSLLSIADVL